jgi:hypothetical protein
MMADRLATPEDLASLLERDDIDAYKAGVLLEMATSIVQGVAGNQRIVQVTGDTDTILGVTDAWLDLPQRPVSAVTAVSLDGTALTAGTDYKTIGNRLWRYNGWQTNYGWPLSYGWPNAYYGWPVPIGLVGVRNEPSQVTFTYSHGYDPTDQRIQLARTTVLSMVAGVYPNPQGLSRVAIDDYQAAYELMSSQIEASPFLRAQIKKQYGRRAGLARIG